jgi:hypothetical protein
MKKTAIVIALLVSAALAGCHKKNANTTPTTGGATEGSAMGSDMGSAATPEGGSDMGGGSAEGGGSAM